MSETIATYTLPEADTVKPQDRDAFYQEQIALHQAGETASVANEVIHVLLFNPSGEFMLQKRSYQKSHNPGLIDKSIGGHVRFADTPDYTVMVETVQELQTPSIVLRTEADFQKTLSLLRSYIETVSLVVHIDTSLLQLERIVDEASVPITSKTHIYFGLYNGRVRPVDREAQGVLWYGQEELQSELEKAPAMFTADLMMLLNNYQKEIQSFLTLVKPDA